MMGPKELYTPISESGDSEATVALFPQGTFLTFRVCSLVTIQQTNSNDSL